MNNRLTAMMVDDCLHDPVLGAKLLLGYDLTPHQELRLWGMWLRKFDIDSSGFGMGKSLSIAIITALRAMLMEDRVAGIISRTFGQAQLVFDYYDRWLKRCPIFASQVAKLNDVDYDAYHGGDHWHYGFKNASIIRAVPPDFMKEAQRVASEDWNDGYFDEWTKYPNYEAFFKNIWTRVRRPISSKYNSEDPIFDRHFFLCGTPRYQWHPCYARIAHYEQEIKAGSLKHELQSWNYHDVPKKYHHLIELDGIRELEQSLSRDMVQQDILGQWVKDSQGYYSFSDIKEARSNECPVLLRGA